VHECGLADADADADADVDLEGEVLDAAGRMGIARVGMFPDSGIGDLDRFGVTGWAVAVDVVTTI
jgi:hypothetical protein